MSHAYQDSSESVIESWQRIHANGEETHVHLLSAGDRYVVLAADIDPREFVGVAGEMIAYSPTRQAAQERAHAWLEQHPKGVAADQGDSNSSKLKDWIMKLDMSDQQSGGNDA